MEERLLLIHGYFKQELNDQELDKYKKCLAGNSKTILVICKNTLKNKNVINILIEKLKSQLDLKKIEYLENYNLTENNLKKEAYIIIYNNALLNQIKFIEKNNEDKHLNQGYKKIILAGYYDPIDTSFIDAIGL